ncbi:hypothetical protein QJS10_CPA07g00693 [Acorus calamus]|uniref:Uncharacterized protein n=1 Tax=Acorus calamus TaxID=4465 RepID=A0AAV9EFP7_ACOCL|nr:hypothetical protein QJS10_CPA07g00693 [Acorus calamus]
MKGCPIRPLNYSSQARPGQPNSNAAIVLPACLSAAPRTEAFVPQQPPQRKYTAIPPPSTFESPVPETIEPIECPKQDSDDDEEFLAGELSELFYPSPIQPESTIQNLRSTEFESPLLLLIQDQVISMPIKPTIMISDDPHLDSSDSEIDQDLDQSIEYVLESEPLIFRNTQFKGTIELSRLPGPLNLHSHLSEEPPLSDSPTISKSIIPYLALESPDCTRR